MLPEWTAWTGVFFVLVVQFELARTGVLLLKNLKEEPRIGPWDTAKMPNVPPLVSIIIPAKDEEAYITPCVRSILASDYPHFEVIVVNDRSTDRTGQLMEELAKEDHRVVTVDVNAVPEGWTGKTHATAFGSEKARGEILLFTDADTQFRPTTLARAAGYFLSKKLDMLSLLPGFLDMGFYERVIHPHLALGFSSFYPLNRVNDPSQRAALASGSFLMITRECYEDVGTWARFRSEITEDVALSKAVKAMGRKLMVMRGSDMIRTRGFKTFDTLARFWRRTFYGGLEKNPLKLLRLTMNYVALTILALLWATSATLAVFGPVTAPLYLLIVLSTLAMVSVIAPYSIFVKGEFGSWVCGLTAPLGILLSGWVAFTTLLTVFHDRGIQWRGSVYK